MNNNVKYIVICGDPVDGLSFIGPFQTRIEATEYGAKNLAVWWVAELAVPAEQPLLSVPALLAGGNEELA